jgi:hypothetical protein
MHNVIIAIQLAAQLARTVAELNETVGKAQAEGRDITAAELGAIVQRRREAEARFLEVADRIGG